MYSHDSDVVANIQNIVFLITISITSSPMIKEHLPFGFSPEWPMNIGLSLYDIAFTLLSTNWFLIDHICQPANSSIISPLAHIFIVIQYISDCWHTLKKQKNKCIYSLSIIIIYLRHSDVCHTWPEKGLNVCCIKKHICKLCTDS